jgi:putative endopeptidase
MKLVYPIVAIMALMTQCKSGEKMESTTEEIKPVVAFDTTNLNSLVSPCENFYHYAIGSWLKNNPVPDTESRWMSFSILGEENRQKTLRIIEETIKVKDAKKGSNEQLIRDLYFSAMDSANLEKNSLNALSPIFEKIDGILNMDDLATVFGYMRTIGVSTPVSFSVGRDDKNSDSYIVKARQSGLSLPDKTYYLSKEEKYQTIRNQYKNHIDKMFDLADLRAPGASTNILKLESDLAEIFWEREDLRDPDKNYNKMTLNSFEAMITSLPIQTLIDQMTSFKIDTILVGQPSFFTSLNKLFRKSDLNHWKTYLKWHVLKSYGPRGGSLLELESFDFFSRKLRGIKEMKPRNERVLSIIDHGLGEPLGKLFVEQHFSKESKEYISTLIENVRKAFGIRIKNLSWMGDSTKELALKKLNTFTYKVGYPDEWKDYSNLDIDSVDLVQNLINISLHRFNFMVEKLGKPVDKNEWHMKPQMVNAYYSASGNEIVFPAGIMQPPFYDPSFDDAINYGGIGAVIGHEFTHGFDDKGSKSDWNGNLKNWWTDTDRAQFEVLTKALADQYSTYEALPGMFVKGDMTLGENIADLGGLTLAFTALQNKIGSETNSTIDGFTWQQRFFLSWANIWKGNITEEALRNRLLTDYHSPMEYRVIGPLANLPQFKEAFGCQGRAMVKSDTAMIQIW